MSAKSWSPDEVSDLKSAVASGRSAGEAAIHLSAKWGRAVTRNAIIGQVRRHGLCLHGSLGKRPQVPSDRLSEVLVHVLEQTSVPDQSARAMAYYAVQQAFPQSSADPVAKHFGFDGPEAARLAVAQAMRFPSWSELLIDEAVGLLVADQYGEQAA